MGIRMKEALFDGKKINISEANEKMRNNLKCIGCNATLTYVGEFIREINGNESKVPAHFRLKNSKVQDHKKGCKYNTVGQLELIAKDSSDDILNQIDEKKFNFRLHLITESLKELEKSNSDLQDNINENKEPKTLNYEKKDEKLEGYLSTMNKILQLKNLMDEDQDISSLVTLQFKDNSGNIKKISWDKFFFETHKYYNLYKYICEKKPQHPLCVMGKVRNVKAPTEEYNFYTIELQFPKWIESEEEYYIPSVAIKVENKKLDNTIVNCLGKEVVIYSKFWTTITKSKTKSKANDKKTLTFLNIKGKIFNKNQIIIIE